MHNDGQGLFLKVLPSEDVLTILTPIWGTKPETASRVRNRIELVLDAAKAHQLRSGEYPARWRGHLDKLLPKRKVSDRGNHAALPWQQVPEFMAELRKSEVLSSLAVQLTVLCAMRTSEVLGATWGEIDLKAEIWTIPAARMKASRPHRIPLSKAVIAILYHLSPDTQNRLLFPGTHDHALYFVR